MKWGKILMVAAAVLAVSCGDKSPTSPSVALSSVAITPTSVTGGTPGQGVVTLGGAAPSGGAAITLGSNSAAVTVPSTVIVPAGATSASFAISTSTVLTRTDVVITAAYGGTSRTAMLSISPTAAPLAFLSLSPSTLVGGTPSEGTVTLSSAAPIGGASISLASNAPTVTVPASITVTAGNTRATFTISTSAVSAALEATITASFGGTSRTATLMLTPSPATLSGLTLNTTGVTGGASFQGTVTLSAAAPAGGAAVSISSSNTVVSVPATIIVAAGATTATFAMVTTSVTAAVNATITATYAGNSRSVTVTVRP